MHPKATLLRGCTTEAQLEGRGSQAQTCPPGLHCPVGYRRQDQAPPAVGSRQDKQPELQLE